MNKALEVLLTVLALAGMYCALPKNGTPVGTTAGAQQQVQVMIADGSDPMPLCRRHCK